MKRLAGHVLALVVVLVLVALGGVAASSSGQNNESSTITDYRADFTVARSGDLSVVETLRVDFPVSRHGIFRFFDTRDPNDSHARFFPQDVSVTRDGQPEPFTNLTKDRGRYRVVRIGDPNRTISGSHVYVIRYTIPTVLLPRDGGKSSEFYWNLIPAGWLMPINRAELTVHLPAAAQDPQCAVGTGASGGCTARSTGPDTLVVTLDQRLAPNTPVTLRTGVALPAPDRSATLPWTQSLDPILGRHPVALVGVLLVALGALLVGLRLTRSTLEEQPGFPLMYAPPDGIGPAQGAYILNEQVDNKAYLASLMHAAEKGGATMSQEKKSWTVSVADPAAWQDLDEVTQRVGAKLGVTTGSFTASRKDVTAGQELKAALSAFRTDVRDWSVRERLMTSAGLGPLGGFVIIGLLVLTGFLALKNPFDMSTVALIPGLFVVGAVGIAYRGAGTKRTRTGRDLWSRVGGFHRILSTPSAQDRFDFSGRTELYTAYLPWAVAFDCADRWAEKYRIETGSEPPVPHYFAGYYGANTAMFVNSMVDSFDSTVQSAISAYNATQSSSSGGGGGFGGGGGGGGGGGSW